MVPLTMFIFMKERKKIILSYYIEYYRGQNYIQLLDS